jgi:hypothetical protein
MVELANDSDSEEYLDDPRTVGDLERENIDLKESMINQMITMEQYLSVAYIQERENPGLFANWKPELPP